MDYIKNLKSASQLLFDRNHQLFLNFNQHTNQAEYAILYLKNKLNTLAAHLTAKPAFHYLDVGCGFGNKTLSIIHTIQKYYSVNTVALDPSAKLLSIFKEQITDQPISLICSTWEDYCPTVKFHFISSIHTFYYINNWEQAIKKMIASLEKKGFLCIAIRSSDVVCKFRDYFYKKIYGEEKKERNSDELCQLLEQLGIPYTIDYVDSLLDIRDCLLQNENGEKLIEFLLRQPYSKLQNIKDDIVMYLKNIHENGYLAQKDGYVWISSPFN